MSKRSSSKGLISARVPPEPPSEPRAHAPDEVVSLPSKDVLDAGVERFLALTHIGVAQPGKDQFAAFDFKDKNGLRIVLGLTYLAMLNYEGKLK